MDVVVVVAVVDVAAVVVLVVLVGAVVVLVGAVDAVVIDSFVDCAVVVVFRKGTGGRNAGDVSFV